VHMLDLLAVARSVGFAQPPRVRPRGAVLPCLASRSRGLTSVQAKVVANLGW